MVLRRRSSFMKKFVVLHIVQHHQYHTPRRLETAHTHRNSVLQSVNQPPQSAESNDRTRLTVHRRLINVRASHFELRLHTQNICSTSTQNRGNITLVVMKTLYRMGSIISPRNTTCQQNGAVTIRPMQLSTNSCNHNVKTLAPQSCLT